MDYFVDWLHGIFDDGLTKLYHRGSVLKMDCRFLNLNQTIWGRGILLNWETKYIVLPICGFIKSAIYIFYFFCIASTYQKILKNLKCFLQARDTIVALLNFFYICDCVIRQKHLQPFPASNVKNCPPRNHTVRIRMFGKNLTV